MDHPENEPRGAGIHDEADLADNLEHVEMDMDKSDGDEDTDSVSTGQNSGTTTNEINPNERDCHQNYHSQTKDDSKNSKDLQSNKSTNSNIICVTNISPTATLEQMTTLFGFLGDIIDIALYHFDNSPETNFKVCFVEYSHHSSVLMAQHLTNTIFIDRALFVLPYNKLKIPPDKETALEAGYGGTEYVTNFNSGVLTQVTTGPGGTQVIATTDSRLTALNLQTYPQLPITTDPTRIEEIRRTLYIGNLDSTLSPEQVWKFFNDIGEVKYIRIAGDDTQPTRFAFVEFTHQASVANALQHNGFVLGSRALKINHSNNPIVKPQIKLDIDDSSKKLRDKRSSSREFGPRDSKHRSSRHDRNRDRTRGRERYYDRRSRRSRSRDKDVIPRMRRSRSRDHLSRRSRSREDLPKRRSRQRESKKRRSVSRSNDRRSKHRSSRRR